MTTPIARDVRPLKIRVEEQTIVYSNALQKFIEISEQEQAIRVKKEKAQKTLSLAKDELRFLEEEAKSFKMPGYAPPIPAMA